MTNKDKGLRWKVVSNGSIIERAELKNIFTWTLAGLALGAEDILESWLPPQKRPCQLLSFSTSDCRAGVSLNDSTVQNGYLELLNASFRGSCRHNSLVLTPASNCSRWEPRSFYTRSRDKVLNELHRDLEDLIELSTFHLVPLFSYPVVQSYLLPQSYCHSPAFSPMIAPTHSRPK